MDGQKHKEKNETQKEEEKTRRPADFFYHLWPICPVPSVFIQVSRVGGEGEGKGTVDGTDAGAGQGQGQQRSSKTFAHQQQTIFDISIQSVGWDGGTLIIFLFLENREI
jgi:hypothetical protein